MVLPKGTRVRWRENQKTRTGSVISLVEGRRSYKVRRDEGGIAHVARSSLTEGRERVLFLEGHLDKNLASRREYGAMMKTWLSAHDVVMDTAKVHNFANLTDFLRKEGNRPNTRIIHVIAHGYVDASQKPYLELTHETVSFAEKIDRFPKLPGKILLLSCCGVGRAKRVMQDLRDSTMAKAVLAYRRDVNDDYTNLTEAMLYACLFERTQKLRTVVGMVYDAMKRLGLRTEDTPARKPVLEIYE